MGLSGRPRRESHVLKLVHPGGFVELHATPIMASQVMNKNPRHYVTRPDFFQFPWIVVSPESILTPGNVFFIVPCHTIRHLVKSTNTNNTNTNTNHTLLSYLFPYQSSLPCRISNSIKIQCFQKQFSLSREYHKQTIGGKMPQSSAREKPVYSSVYTSCDSGKVKAWTRSGSFSASFSHSKQTPKLKPCLKKDKNHNARRRDLKVLFVFNDHDANNPNFTTKVFNQS
ncbi:unnamed protein product [Sphenostylis stenocarpa]|uniref:Uncharacterized protein n=1 Tax=Sphenostylis stenocarpa TaxID=92480 RepID=A0AA86SIK3_9FABA|nr:unnamed protein product [Sphenostylis stenocarpa]